VLFDSALQQHFAVLVLFWLSTFASERSRPLMSALQNQFQRYADNSRALTVVDLVTWFGWGAGYPGYIEHADWQWVGRYWSQSMQITSGFYKRSTNSASTCDYACFTYKCNLHVKSVGD